MQWTDKLYILDTVHSTQYTVHNMQYTMYSVHCTVYVMYVLCTVYCVFVVYAVPSKPYNVHCTQYTLLADLFIAYYTVYTIRYHYKLYNDIHKYIMHKCAHCANCKDLHYKYGNISVSILKKSFR